MKVFDLGPDFFGAMPNFTVDQMRQIMDKTDNIRSMSVIAHLDVERWFESGEKGSTCNLKN